MFFLRPFKYPLNTITQVCILRIIINYLQVLSTILSTYTRCYIIIFAINAVQLKIININLISGNM